MAVLRLSEIHHAHVTSICATWAEGPSSDHPNEAAFKPMLIAVYRDRKQRTKERVMVARVPEARVEAARALGRSLARDELKPFAVTQATEAWGAPDDGGGAPSDRVDRHEVLGISTAQADGRTLTTMRWIVRSEGGEAALGDLVYDAEAGFEAALSAITFDFARIRNNGGGGG